MEELMKDLNVLVAEIQETEAQITQAEVKAENNIKPLKQQLSQIREDKRTFAQKSDFESVQNCIRKENNLKFKIDAQWNECSILKSRLHNLNNQKQDLENQIKLKKDQIKRNNQIKAQMDRVLENYRKSQSLRQASIDSKVSHDHVQQWYEWGRNNFNETYAYFYSKIIEIDNYFKDEQTQKLKRQMDDVIEAYRKTNSLKEASKMADVSYNTVQYWYDWGSRGFGEENTYFFKKLMG